MTPNQEQCIKKARELHPDWEVRVWQDPVDPQEMRLAKYWSKANSGAQLADLIRLDVVGRFGGFYLDSDFVINRSLESLRAYDCVICTENGRLLTNAFFGAVPMAAPIQHLIDALDREEVNWADAPNDTTGPEMFTRELKWTAGVTVLPKETFYPYNWDESSKGSRLWTYGTHLWDHSWKKDRSLLRRSAATVRRGMVGTVKWGIKSMKDLARELAVRTACLFPRPYQAEGVICVQNVHGMQMFLSGADTSVTPEIAHNGTYEYAEEKFFLKLVRSGDWVIDVGANVGIMTLIFAKQVNEFGRVFSYEPNPLPMGLLKKSLVANWVHNRVVLKPFAVGSEPGHLDLRFSRESLGGATLSKPDTAGTFEQTASYVASEEVVRVEVHTLDADFPVDLPIRLLKIDVEGFEHNVLAGASRLLSRQCVDVLMLECIREVYGAAWPMFIAEIRKLLANGYGTYRLNRWGKLVPIPLEQHLSGRFGRNLFLVANHATDTIAGLQK